jgi:hypothetical protein
MSTNLPVRVVVTVPPVKSKIPALLVKLFGAASPISVKGIGQPDCMVPHCVPVGQTPVLVSG